MATDAPMTSPYAPIIERLETTRVVTTAERPWLDADIPAGTPVFRYAGYTYGCISSGGVAVTAEEGKLPFFEVPRPSLRALEAKERQP